VLQLMDAVLADVRVYRTAHLLVSSSVQASSQQRTKKPTDREERCVVTLFHECRRIFASVYSPSTGQRWMAVISEDDIDTLLTPTAMPMGGARADKLPPQSHTDMYARLARLCLLQKRRLEDCPASIASPSPYELVLRPHAVRLYRHVVLLGGYLATITIVELARGHVQVDAFVHGSNSYSTSTQAVALTLAVDLETVLGRMSAVQARRFFVSAARLPALMLDRLRLYGITRTQMKVPECQPKAAASLRLSVRTTESSPGRVLLRRAVRVPGDQEGARPGERWVFTLSERHEREDFQAVFYAPGSSASHSIRISSGAAEELLELSRHATASQLQRVLLRRFCLAKPPEEVLGSSHEDVEQESDGPETEADWVSLYRLRRRILARFPCVLRVMEDPHQRISKKQIVRAYVQVELCDHEPEGEERKSTDAVRYRVWRPGSCAEQTLLLQQNEIEASLPLEASWQHASLTERKGVSRDIVRCYFAWDPNGGGENGSVVAHLPCGSFWASEAAPVLGLGSHHSNFEPPSSPVEQTEMLERLPRGQEKSNADVVVVSCVRLLDDRSTESDDEEDDADEASEAKRKQEVFSYDTEELVHRGSYRANGLYVVVRVTMRAEVRRDLQPALASPTDRVRERDSFTMTFHVYHPASSGAASAEIHGRRDLREVVGPDKPFLIASDSLDGLMRHIILTRLDAQVDRGSSSSTECLKVAFLRDRLYAKQKATPVTRTFDRDADVNAAKLIDETRRHGDAGERGVKVLTTAKVLPGCGRTLLTVFDVAASQRFGPVESSNSVLLRVDAYVCATSMRLSLLLEGSDLVHVVGDEDRELLLPMAHADASSAESVALEKERSRKVALMVLDHLRVEHRSDGRGDRLVLSDYSCSATDTSTDKSKMRLFKTVRAVGHDQVLLSAYLGEGEEHQPSCRLELYHPASSSRCTLKPSGSTLRALLGIPESLALDQFLSTTMEGPARDNLTAHFCSMLHIEKLSAISDGAVDSPSRFTMTLLFDEHQAMECMKQHIGHDGSSTAIPQCSWTGAAAGKDGQYFSVHLQLLQEQQGDRRWLTCSAFAPAELLVGARTFEWAEIPAELTAHLSAVDERQRSKESTAFLAQVCEQLHIELQRGDGGLGCDALKYDALRSKGIALSF